MNDVASIAPLYVNPHLRAIMDEEYPRFSDTEYERRHELLGEVMGKANVDHLLVVTDQRTGNATQWVTGWPGTVEALVIFKPGEQIVMHMEWHNHLPLGKNIARGVDVRWGEHQGIAKTIAELKRRGARRVGLMGPLGIRKYQQLAREFDVVLLDKEYVRLRCDIGSSGVPEGAVSENGRLCHGDGTRGSGASRRPFDGSLMNQVVLELTSWVL